MHEDVWVCCSNRKRKRTFTESFKVKVSQKPMVFCFFRLAFFEVKYQFYRQDKLMWAVVRHYSEQVTAVQQRFT